MTQVLYGDRLGRQGQLRLGCSAIIFDGHKRVLLTRRADNGQWCLPGGAMDSGESVVEACERELWEETGLRVRVKRLVGVYSDPDQLVIYPDGNKVFVVALSFEAEITDGTPELSNETTEVGFFSVNEMETMPILANHQLRVEDALLNRAEAFIK